MAQNWIDEEQKIVVVNKTTTATTATALAEGIVSSTNFHENYPNELSTTETMYDDAGLVLRLELTDFDIEYEDSCNYNSLTISETKPNEKARTLMAKHCGDILPPVIISTTNKVDLMFKTDGSVTSTGWSVKRTAITPNA